MVRRRFRPLVVLAAVAGVVLLIAVAAGAFGGHDKAEASIRSQLVACASEGMDTRQACLQRVFAHAARKGRVEETLSGLEWLVHHRKLDDCHLEAHELAHAAFAVFQNVDKLFLVGGPQCRLGFIHGAVEASVSGPHARIGSAHTPIRPPCAELRGPDLRGACSHGYGHALMIWTGSDLRASVRGCERAAREGVGVLACEAGVMMQNGFDYSSLPPTRFRRAVAAKCALVHGPDLEDACYENLGVVAALRFRHDRAPSEAICRRVAARVDRASCLRGVHEEIEESRTRG